MKLRIGTKLLAIREDRNMTQLDMADLLGIPDSTYARYERNETQIDYNKLVTFAEKLKVPVQELLPDTVSITNNSTGNGGSVVFGNQYFYFGDNDENQTLLKENKELKDKIADLESKLEEILTKISKGQ
jgi:transcriptional regulator with XRE-family HTH domain